MVRHSLCKVPYGKVHGANMGPIWGWQDPGGPHVDPMNFAMWGSLYWEAGIHFPTRQGLHKKTKYTVRTGIEEADLNSYIKSNRYMAGFVWI